MRPVCRVAELGSLAVMERTASLMLYPTTETFEILVLLKRDRCLEFLLPYLQRCRSSRFMTGRVAEVAFDDGLLVWFTSDAGQIAVHRSRPIFGKSRTWLRVLPAPARRHSAFEVSDETVRDFVSSAYEIDG
jgi:hypothetical protein